MGPGNPSETGPVGPEGPTGPKGNTGPQGSSGFGEPDFDSGWTSIKKGQTINWGHKYGSNILVYVLGRVDGAADKIAMIHQTHLGMEIYDTTKTGLIWYIIDGKDEITVSRSPIDEKWDQARVMIWEIPS